MKWDHSDMRHARFGFYFWVVVTILQGIKLLLGL
jgi:hypothetical protein